MLKVSKPLGWAGLLAEETATHPKRVMGIFKYEGGYEIRIKTYYKDGEFTNRVALSEEGLSILKELLAIPEEEYSPVPLELIQKNPRQWIDNSRQY
jgi:hypothetical protein